MLFTHIHNLGFDVRKPFKKFWLMVINHPYFDKGGVKAALMWMAVDLVWFHFGHRNQPKAIWIVIMLNMLKLPLF